MSRGMIRGGVGWCAASLAVAACAPGAGGGAASVPAPPAASSSAESQGTAPADVGARARDFVANLARGSFDGAVATFGDTMQAALPAEKLAALWQALEDQVGTFARLERVRLASRDGVTVAFARCRFARAEKVVQIAYDAQLRVVGLFFIDPPAEAPWTPPSYADPSSFDEQDVVVGTRPELPGVLTMPKGAGPFPAVVLVHGSGPVDVDESIGRSKTFKDLAFGLASRGVAVIRYAKRSLVDPRGVTTVKEESIDGARAAVDRLAATPRIDTARLVIVGHSLGGYLAPRIAREDGRVAAIVVLAGNARPIEDLLVEQLRRRGAPAAAIDEALRLKAIVDDPQLTPDRPLPPIAGGTSGAYFLDLRGYRPVDVAAQLARPVLVLQGERDVQVVQTDFDLWRQGVCATPRGLCKSYPGLGHAFVPVDGGVPRDATPHVSRDVVDDVAAWVRALPGH